MRDGKDQGNQRGQIEKIIRIMLAVGYLVLAVPLALTLPLKNSGFAIIIILIIVGLIFLRKGLFIQYIAFLLILILFLQTKFVSSGPFITLLPNLDVRIEIVGNDLPGINGPRILTTDAKGFRVTKAVNYEVAGPLRIFAIGGSTTEQYIVDDRKTSFSLLQTWLEDLVHMQVEVINTGVSGLRATHHLATLQEIEKYHPRLVLIMMGANDWIRDIKMNNKPLARIRDLLIGKVDFLESPLCRILRRGYKVIWDRDIMGDNEMVIDYRQYSPFQRDSLSRKTKLEYRPNVVSDDYRYYVDKILERCSNGSYKTLIISQISAYHNAASGELKKLFSFTPPNENYTLSFEAMVHIADLYNRFLESETKKMNIPFCDAASRMPPTTDFFYDDLHPNDRGARRLAELIFESLKTQALFRP